MKLKQLLSKGLEQTAALWSPLTISDNWIHQAAQILAEHAQFDEPIVHLCFQALIEVMSARQTCVSCLFSGIIHFLKVTASYWSGLFYCYSVPGLPRTNNDLEHIFATVRHHQRRCTGRKVAPASLVLRGSVQLVACVATQIKPWCAQQLAAVSVADWRSLRSQLEQHRINRALATTFSTFSC